MAMVAVEVVLGGAARRSPGRLERRAALHQRDLVERERWSSKEAVREKSEEVGMAGRRWADAKTGGPATGIDGPVGLDVGVIEVERGLGRRKRRVGSAARRCDRRKGEVGGGRVGQATVGALSGVRGARVIACSGRVGQRANAG